MISNYNPLLHLALELPKFINIVKNNYVKMPNVKDILTIFYKIIMNPSNNNIINNNNIHNIHN
jgi:hypothetical protein